MITLDYQGVHAKLYDMDYALRCWCECSIEKRWWCGHAWRSHHDADEEPGVNMEPMATVNDVFKNMLADDTEDNDGIS